MKTITRNSIYKIIVIICFFTFGNAYSQDKKPTNKTLFGKTVKPESINPKNGKIRCATVEYEEYLQGKNPKRLSESQFESWLAPLVSRHKAMRTSSQSGGIITIPVVVHVIYNGQAIGVAPNITDNQVISQITVLNQDFRKMLGSPGSNTNPIGADTQIQFALAQVDPNGNPTNGIDRVSLCQDSWSENEMNATIKPSTIWDPTQYMNMWTVQFTDNDLLGYAQFPDASGLDGLDASGGTANTDGVVSLYSVFGSKAYDDGTFILGAPYDKGRTMTHEVGHWLGLRHIWGDGNGDEDNNNPDCTASDYCADTPQVGWEHYTCGTYDTCPFSAGNDMPENYMDYTPDACMNIFTLNQKDRITTIINNAARRSTLKTSTKNLPITLFANDAELKLEASCDVATCGASTNQTVQKIIIYNRGTSNLTSATINYNINGGGNTAYNWTGNLTTNKFAVISITINAVSTGTINATVTTANGVTDQRTTNNSVSGTFIIPTATPSYAFTNYVFRLQQDLWGSETTWNIKDNNGTTLFSGGPYTDKANLPLPALITENWTLASNKCYIFTINDSQSDGICCGDGGNGYYDIKSTGGTVITSGSTFYSSKSYTFTTGTLGTNEFETSPDIYLYPNPTKGILNIQIPSNFGLPNSYSINNVLGQNISQKEITKETDLTINTSTLSNGTYFITIAKDEQKRTLKFIKE
ncbi:MAG: T9SS type A sorting domain-containing protein [Bacteroidota bacterium]